MYCNSIVLHLNRISCDLRLTYIHNITSCILNSLLPYYSINCFDVRESSMLMYLDVRESSM